MYSWYQLLISSKCMRTLQWISDGRLHFPADRSLPLQPHTRVPFVLVADDAFPLGKQILKPYALQGLSYEERVFNYRLSRARIENVFGILASRFRIFLGAIHMAPKRAKYVILAAATLHNFLRSRNPCPTSLQQLWIRTTQRAPSEEVSGVRIPKSWCNLRSAAAETQLWKQRRSVAPTHSTSTPLVPYPGKDVCCRSTGTDQLQTR